ncbi:MAG: hypothetical protein M9905_21020 [Rhizobiaceae bacterium]|nr:hypothetical protein [Rhizobiaceae bacterium]
MKPILSRALRWGIAGVLIGPATFYCLMLVALYIDPACRGGAPGACQLDVGLNMAIAAVGGFILFFGVSLIRNLVRYMRDETGNGGE